MALFCFGLTWLRTFECDFGLARAKDAWRCALVLAFVSFEFIGAIFFYCTRVLGRPGASSASSI
jgi:hypothetical protein